MSAVKCKIVGTFGPNLVCLVQTRDGSIEVPVHLSSLRDKVAIKENNHNFVDVGNIIAKDGPYHLVEFDQEDFQGYHRRWIFEGDMIR